MLRFTYIFSIILTAEFIGAIDDNMILQDTGYYIRNIYVFDSVLLIIRTLIICSVDYKIVWLVYKENGINEILALFSL